MFEVEVDLPEREELGSNILHPENT